MDPTNISISDFFAKGVSAGAVILFLLYIIKTLWTRYIAVEDKRDKDSLERESTMTVALNTATHTIESTGETLRSILITLEKQNGQSKTENKD
jgi:hypothetical protein